MFQKMFSAKLMEMEKASRKSSLVNLKVTLYPSFTFWYPGEFSF